MAFSRDHGHCCLFLPLKFGVALISMYIFFMSVVDIMALLNFSQRNQIRMQSGGYNLGWERLNTWIGALGIVIGFLGLLGIYDDKLSWIKAFAYYIFVRLGAAFVVALFDYRTLRNDCVGFAVQDLPPAEQTWDLHQHNAPLHSLSEQGVCAAATTAYLFGFALDFALNAYLAHAVWRYQRQIECEPPHPIDFGLETLDKTGRWDFFRVNEVPFYANQRMQAEGTPLMETAAPDNSRSAESDDYGAAKQV